uniref:V-set and transmembrane domain containing 5 n=1 Tax=Varanus komodoensis TaxID=61221 RepID=A0A8D2PZF0_VARKO
MSGEDRKKDGSTIRWHWPHSLPPPCSLRRIKRKGMSSCQKGKVPLLFTITLSFGFFAAQGGEASLLVSQPNLNTTVNRDILLSVAHTARNPPVIEWKHTSPRGTTKIAEWKPGSYTNISLSYENRVNTYENGSLQLLQVEMTDSGYYLVTVRDEFGNTIYGTILLNVYEILYEDLHFVAVFFTFLTAVSAILVCFMWLCNKSIYLIQNEQRQLRGKLTWLSSTRCCPGVYNSHNPQQV